MVERYEYKPRMGTLEQQSGFPALFSVNTTMVKAADYDKLETALRNLLAAVDNPKSENEPWQHMQARAALTASETSAESK